MAQVLMINWYRRCEEKREVEVWCPSLGLGSWESGRRSMLGKFG